MPPRSLKPVLTLVFKTERTNASPFVEQESCMTDSGPLESELARLTALYNTYNDETLVTMNPDELTDVARQVLEVQLTIRNLQRCTPEPGEAHMPAVQIFVWEGKAMAWAETAANVLRTHNIPADTLFVPDQPTSRRFRVTVAPADAERALDILSGKKVEDLSKELLKELEGSTFVVPTCPECG
jgi:hypothetical protein